MTANTAASASINSMPGLYPYGPNGQRVAIEGLMPIHVVEGFYSPMMREKSSELDNISNRISNLKREKYQISREHKNLTL